MPEELEDLLADWVAMPGPDRAALLARRPALDRDSELAALARSVAVPGLRHRLAAYAATVLTKEKIA